MLFGRAVFVDLNAYIFESYYDVFEISFSKTKQETKWNLIIILDKNNKCKVYGHGYIAASGAGEWQRCASIMYEGVQCI